MSGVRSSWDNGTRVSLLLKGMVELEMSGLGHTDSCREEWPHSSGFSWEPRADRSFFGFSKQGRARSGDRTSKNSRAGKQCGWMKRQHKDSGAGAGTGLGQNQWHHLSDISDITVIIFIFVGILLWMMSSNFLVDSEFNETLLWLEQMVFGSQLRQFFWHFLAFSSPFSDKRRLFQRKYSFHLENGVFVGGGEERFFPLASFKDFHIFPDRKQFVDIILCSWKPSFDPTFILWKCRR